MLTGIINKDKLLDSINYCEKLYKDHSNFPEGSIILKKCLKTCKLFERSFFTLYLLECLVLILFCQLLQIFTPFKLLLVNLYVPYLDTDTTLGYEGTLYYQFYICLLTVIGLASYDSMFCIFIIHSDAIAKIIVYKLSEINEKLILSVKENNHIIAIEKELIAVIKIHQKFNEYFI